MFRILDVANFIARIGLRRQIVSVLEWFIMFAAMVLPLPVQKPLRSGIGCTWAFPN